ncbi:UUP1 family membrane protein [Wohlfahrtiimonas sp. G9077]|uniref:UUP1 family membrane protein n=1 Tax=Wohlfahrtiimonas sp. G9077 TaxID=1980118 RepID=UPI000B982023|nr:UUP1 family membrane protein [Wohlfahrtiimonas sp. G9077]OYQ72418.1 hypothetical protein B9T20_09810 [Wohlfahrtiimonas sp. G9077]
MKSLTLHLKILITLLLVIGFGSIAYQALVLKIPLTEDSRGSVWTIDTKINFNVRGSKPVKVKLFIPSKENGLSTVILEDDNILARNYGVAREIDPLGNQQLILSSRRATGDQTLYYRLLVSEEAGNVERYIGPKGLVYREPIPLDGAQKVAADSLIASIRELSSDTATFVSEAIQTLNDRRNDYAKTLLEGDYSIENRGKVLEILLSQARIPIQFVHTLKLSIGSNQKPQMFVRSYIEKSQDEKKLGEWVYFDLNSGQRGLTNDRLIWWVGNDPLLTVSNDIKASINFSLDDRELTSKGIISNKVNNAEASSFLTYSLYSLPIQIQETYLTMIVIPFGVLAILIFRNIVGVQTLGTFTPVLIALAFRETGLVFGIFLFSIIVAIGLAIRSYLEHLKLQMLPRLSIVLTCVVILIAILSLVSHKLGLDQGLSVTLFPMVILTMTIERLSVTWEERGGAFAFKVALGTFFTGSIAFYVMNLNELSYFAFTFPGILLILIAFMLAMGRYRGYRLTELVRFKALVKEG